MFVKRWMDGMLGCNAMRTLRKAKSKPISKFMMMAKNGSFCWARRRHNKKAIRVCWYILHNVISQQQTNKQLLVWALARSLTLTILLAFRLYFILVSWHVCMNFVVECQKWIFAFWIWYSCCCTNRKKTKKRQRIYIYIWNWQIYVVFDAVVVLSVVAFPIYKHFSFQSSVKTMVNELFQSQYKAYVCEQHRHLVFANVENLRVYEQVYECPRAHFFSCWNRLLSSHDKLSSRELEKKCV